MSGRLDASNMVIGYNYQYSVDDPKYYAEPWRGEFSFIREDSDHIYEYACHEGNYGMANILSGHRAQERFAAESGSQN